MQHVNYDITVTQDGKTVLDETSVHTHSGIKYYATQQLNSNSALEIDMTLLGLGLPEEAVRWKGPRGEVIEFTAVLEFGTIAGMILAMAIVSIVAVTAKSKLSLIPRI